MQELRKVNEGEIEFQRREIARVHTEYRRIESKIQVLFDMRLDSSITQDEYDKKTATA